MGNGAGLHADQTSVSKADFDTIEGLCREGYFRESYTEFKKAVYAAIRNNNVDVLEILIPAGNMRKIKPLHVAASMAKLDPLEVLCSAGFEGNSTDKEGRTPLHMCCNHASHESALCATFLMLQFKKIINQCDNAGMTPLHLAVTNMNTDVVKALVNNGANVRITDKNGKTPLKMAQSMGFAGIAQILSAGGALEMEPTAFNSSNDVDQERIMKIWETFFENAFKRFDDPNYVMAAPSDDLVSRKKAKAKKAYDDQRAMFFDEDDGNEKRHSRKKTLSKQSTGSLALGYDGEVAQKCDYGSYYNYKDVESKKSTSVVAAENSLKKATAGGEGGAAGAGLKKTSNPPLAPCIMSEKDCLLSWFAWIIIWDEDQQALFYDENAAADDCYYVIHRDSGETRWLRSHLDLMFDSKVLESNYTTFDSEELEQFKWKELPTTLYDAMSDFWLTYYDPLTNSCSWMSLPTKSIEHYLPLGINEKSKRISKMKKVISLAPTVSEDGDATTWFPADQYCAMSWVVVIIQATAPPLDTDTATATATIAYAFPDEYIVEEAQSKGDRSARSDTSKASIKSDNVWDTDVDQSSKTIIIDDDKYYACITEDKKQQYYDNEQDSSRNTIDWYYMNTVTKRVSWDQPANWDEITTDWGDWTLCVNEEAPDDMFWYDFASGDSRWVEYS